VLTGLALGAAAVLVLTALTEPVGIWSPLYGATALVLVLVGAYLAYWTLVCASLSYRLDRNRLELIWLGGRIWLPTYRLRPANHPGGFPEFRQLQGIAWPGFWLGRDRDADGPVYVAAAHHPGQLVYLTTGSLVYVLGVPDRAAFEEQLETLKLAGPLVPTAEGAVREGPVRPAIFDDMAAVVPVAVGVGLSLGLFMYLALLYPRLPEIIPLHFNAFGQPDFIGYRSDIFRLPGFGLFLLLLNTVLGAVLYRLDRFAALILLWTIPAVQAMFWFAVFRLVSIYCC
jgi:hypothetical protein